MAITSDETISPYSSTNGWNFSGDAQTQSQRTESEGLYAADNSPISCESVTSGFAAIESVRYSAADMTTGTKIQ
jgi:hypothetical protein